MSVYVADVYVAPKCHVLPCLGKAFYPATLTEKLLQGLVFPKTATVHIPPPTQWSSGPETDVKINGEI